MYKIELSPYHKIFYSEWRIAPDSSKYNIVFDQTLSGNLDLSRLERSLIKFVSNNLLINSHIIEDNDHVYWTRNTEIGSLEYFGNNKHKTVSSYINQTFNLLNGPLYRFGIFSNKNNSYRFIIVLHHIIIDGKSFNELITEISNYYNDEYYVGKFNITRQKNILRLTNSALSKAVELNKTSNIDFWNSELRNIEPLDLRFLKVERYKKDSGYRVQSLNFTFNKDIVKKVISLKQKYMLSPYQYSQLVFAILLYKYTSQTKFAISYPVAVKECTSLIHGAGINTSIIIYDIQPTMTLEKLINDTQYVISRLKSNTKDNGSCPVNEILSNSHKQLLDVFFAQTDLKKSKLNFENIKVLKVNSNSSIDLPVKLLFEQEVKNDYINFRIKYDRSETDKKLLEIFLSKYKTLFVEILHDLSIDLKQKTIADYSILSIPEFKQICYDWNKTKKFLHSGKTIHECFQNQVIKTPDNIAVVFEDKRLTYSELNQVANKMAHYLRHKFSGKHGDLIALFLERSEKMIISILAVLKIGCAYVPIDSSYPNEKIAYILEDIKTKLVITNERYLSKFDQIRLLLESKKSRPIEDFPLIFAMDNKKNQESIFHEKSTNLKLNYKPTDLAYIIYTSGTTGKPKGVMVEHAGPINTIYAIKNAYSAKKKTLKITAFTSYVFDVSISEFFIALFNGHELHILNEELRHDVTLLSKYLDIHEINYAYLPPAILAIMPKVEYQALNGLIYAGEPCDRETGLYWGSRYKLFNYFGPTEASIYATGLQIKNGETNLIGKPIHNVTCYILNSNLEIVPIGALGELYIGGIGLSRGYLNQPELTKEKFINSPFQNKITKSKSQSEKLYKTGDIVRLLSDGNLEYLGRNDFQVKIRGYRVEISGIENALLSYPDIKQATVIIKDASNKGTLVNSKYLVAYYTASEKIEEPVLIEYLSNRLPEYMVPNIIVFLKDMPLTINGKINRDALPDPKIKTIYKAPVNKQEEIICNSYKKILGLRKIGINDNFFHIGGDSIKAISLLIELQNYFNIKIADIFNFKTPKLISENVTVGGNSAVQKLSQIKKFLKSANPINNNIPLSESFSSKLKDYYTRIKKLKIKINSKKSIKNILLTGATGYLGCNILNQLLLTTEYHIFLIIRGNDKSSIINRMSEKFKFYFNVDLFRTYGNRISVVLGDIEKNNLGLNKREYVKLYTMVDSVIHSAALVKHYGDYNVFYKSNVEATINLLEFSQETKLKDFHYISTYSILEYAYEQNDEYAIYTEDDVPKQLRIKNHPYIYSKWQGELQVIKYRLQGVNANIYRVGNLAFISGTYKMQENKGDNAFYNWLKCILKIKLISEDINAMELSPVDATAKAIVKIFDKIDLVNQNFHIYNPNLFRLNTEISDKLLVTKVDIGNFIDNIVSHIGDKSYHGYITKFLLKQGWLEDYYIRNDIFAQIKQDKTQLILGKLNFIWKPITNNMFYNYIVENFDYNGRDK